jgi:pilus assembly protein Flp/PilA
VSPRQKGDVRILSTKLSLLFTSTKVLHMIRIPWHDDCTVRRRLKRCLAPQNFKRGNCMKSLMIRLWQEEEGQDLTEYGLLLVLVALAAITSMSTLANAIKTVFSTAATNLSAS